MSTLPRKKKATLVNKSPRQRSQSLTNLRDVDGGILQHCPAVRKWKSFCKLDSEETEIFINYCFAVHEWQRQIKSDPNNTVKNWILAQILHHIGQCYYEEGRLANSLYYFREALDLQKCTQLREKVTKLETRLFLKSKYESTPESLPTEVIGIIASNLGVRSFVHFSMTCQRMRCVLEGAKLSYRQPCGSLVLRAELNDDKYHFVLKVPGLRVCEKIDAAHEIFPRIRYFLRLVSFECFKLVDFLHCREALKFLEEPQWKKLGTSNVKYVSSRIRGADSASQTTPGHPNSGAPETESTALGFLRRILQFLGF